MSTSYEAIVPIMAEKDGRTRLILWRRYIERFGTEIGVFLPLAQNAIAQELSFLFHATNFGGVKAQGNGRVYTNTAVTTIDEETNAAVAAYARFDDTGGNGSAASASTFDATMTRVPLEDNEGRTAYYHGHWKHISWAPHIAAKHKQFVHQRSFALSNAVQLNVPGTNTLDEKAFVYYDSHANFSISSSISISLWFYPTEITQHSSEFFHFLVQRYIDASNYFLLCFANAGGDIGKVFAFVNEGGAATKIVSTTTINLNAWNLLIFTYNPATNAAIIYLNNVSSTTSYVGSAPALHTGDSNMYLGGRPFDSVVRFTGYLDNFVFWTGKILTGTEASNMWTKGTII